MTYSDITRNEYADGRADGFEQGSYDASLGLGITSDVLAELRSEATQTQGRRSRAYGLGYLRGYRAAIRTQNARGEWGT